MRLATWASSWPSSSSVEATSRLLSKQFGDLAEFIVTAGEVDGVGPPRGKITLRSYFEELEADPS